VAIDLVDQLGAVRREVRTTTRNGAEAKSVVATQTYDTDIADVWDAITSAERVPRWFLPLSGDLRPGGRYQLEGNAGGTITECEPPSRLTLTWEWGEDVSWLSVRLTTADGDRTTLELEHTALVQAHWTEFGPGAVGIGWDLALWGLAQHLAHDVSVDPAGAMAWMVSQEGRDYMTRCSEAWGAAAVAAGDDPEQARAAAARTAAAYTAAPEPEGATG
jgi:uncharacterized protein YndB with AHSA1/START domain